jgi:hypothetical protein
MTPISCGGVLTGDPDLPESWWRAETERLIDDQRAPDELA